MKFKPAVKMPPLKKKPAAKKAKGPLPMHKRMAKAMDLDSDGY